MAPSTTTPTDPLEFLQWNMILAHQTFKAGYGSIVKRLDDPPLKDLDNFLGYCNAWSTSIHEHHDTEEVLVFPFLNKKLDFSAEAHEHEGILAALEKFNAYLEVARADHSKFSGAELKAMMEGFRDELINHLDEEVAHLAPEKLSVFTLEEISDINGKLDAYAKSHGNPLVLVPFMRSHTAPEYKDSFPPMPWVLRKVVIPVMALRHSGYWKYAPYALS